MIPETQYGKPGSDVHLCSIEMKKKQFSFTGPDHKEIQQGIYNKIPLEKLLKHIHHQFSDEGLIYTLIHCIYSSSDHEIEYYVPEMVYIAVKKCLPMRMLLVHKASQNENLRRLILWNVKAFTVLMKQKDEDLRSIIDKFEEEIISSVPNQNKFKFSEKAISMLTSASLILKTMPKEEQKAKLNKFIQRFNYQILNNFQHCIIIPFRTIENQLYHSNFVVNIVEDNCSCFPTRKRVPYRIVFETIDARELLDPKFTRFQRKNRKKPLSEQSRDLFEEAEKQANEVFTVADKSYPFVIDNQQSANNTKLSEFAKNIESEEKRLSNSKHMKARYLQRKETGKSRQGFLERDAEGNKFEIKDNDQLRKYDAIYIPTLPSEMRKSETDARLLRRIEANENRFRWTQRYSDPVEQFIKIVQEEPKYNNGIKVDEIWGVPWDISIRKLRQSSAHKQFSSLRFHNVVIKGGDDLRQQIICMQIICKIESILKDASLDIFIKPYQIIVLSENSGLLQFVSNSISVDGIKKQMEMDLPEFYLEVFNSESKFLEAKLRFIRSLAGSSILTYVLRLKDRHNGNILIDKDGNIIHIDFGFILGMSPGGINFQSSPFKLTEQYMVLMGGKNSEDYLYFKQLFCQGMSALRKRVSEMSLLLEIMMEDSDLECFQNFRIQTFASRFEPNLSEEKFKVFCESLVDKSCMNSRTAHYDTFQKLTNGIMP